MADLITIDVRREDGEVTRISGSAGLAVVMRGDPDAETPLRELDPPTVSLRFRSEDQATVLLAGIISAYMAHVPGAVLAAVELSKRFDSGAPALRRELPPHKASGGAE